MFSYAMSGSLQMHDAHSYEIIVCVFSVHDEFKVQLSLNTEL